jgi:hypothetical protein
MDTTLQTNQCKKGDISKDIFDEPAVPIFLKLPRQKQDNNNKHITKKGLFLILFVGAKTSILVCAVVYSS